MKFPVSPHIEAVQYPPISEVKGWLAGRTFLPERPLVDLCQAVPDYPPAAELTEFLAGALADPLISKYTSDEGLPEVREAVAAWYARHYGAGPKASEICLTIGASQAFWLAMVVLCRAGDEVIIPLPAYFDHPMALQSLGIVCRFVPFDPANGGLPDPEAIARQITPRTRAILVVTPSNPTGANASPEMLQKLCRLARERRIALVLDETYNAFADEAPPHRLFADPAGAIIWCIWRPLAKPLLSPVFAPGRWSLPNGSSITPSRCRIRWRSASRTSRNGQCNSAVKSSMPGCRKSGRDAPPARPFSRRVRAGRQPLSIGGKRRFFCLGAASPSGRQRPPGGPPPGRRSKPSLPARRGLRPRTGKLSAPGFRQYPRGRNP